MICGFLNTARPSDQKPYQNCSIISLRIRNPGFSYDPFKQMLALLIFSDSHAPAL